MRDAVMKISSELNQAFTFSSALQIIELCDESIEF